VTGTSSLALVTRNRWFLARPAALLLVSLRRLVSADSALVATLGLLLRVLAPRVRWFLSSSCSFAAGLALPAGPEAASRLLLLLSLLAATPLVSRASLRQQIP
jgi:hypothetical protein